VEVEVGVKAVSVRRCSVGVLRGVEGSETGHDRDLFEEMSMVLRGCFAEVLVEELIASAARTNSFQKESRDRRKKSITNNPDTVTYIPMLNNILLNTHTAPKFLPALCTSATPTQPQPYSCFCGSGYVLSSFLQPPNLPIQRPCHRIVIKGVRVNCIQGAHHSSSIYPLL
jgi:hypothetical protein